MRTKNVAAYPKGVVALARIEVCQDSKREDS